MIRGLLSYTEWAFFAPFVTETEPLRNRKPRDHRRILDAVFGIARTGAAWRDLPEERGHLKSVHRQYRSWTASVLWDLMAEHDNSPEVMLADQGDENDAIRDRIRASAGRPEIPTKKNRRVQHSVNQVLYAIRDRTERFFDRRKISRRMAIRYNHTASSFLGFAKLATIKQ